MILFSAKKILTYSANFQTKEKIYVDLPLGNQLDHFDKKFIADLEFGKKIHKILSDRQTSPLNHLTANGE